MTKEKNKKLNVETAKRELVQFDESSISDPFSQEVQDSYFYKFMQTATELNAKGWREVPQSSMVLLAKIAAMSPYLHTLNLGCNLLGSEHAVDITNALSTSTSLRVLNIEENSITGEGEGVDVIKGLIKIPHLETLIMSGNILRVWWLPVSKDIAKLPALKVLVMEKCELKKYAPFVAKSLSQSLTLEVINISNNQLDPDVVEVAKTLSLLPTLKELDMSRERLPSDNNGRLYETIASDLYNIVRTLAELGSGSLLKITVKNYLPDISALQRINGLSGSDAYWKYNMAKAAAYMSLKDHNDGVKELLSFELQFMPEVVITIIGEYTCFKIDLVLE